VAVSLEVAVSPEGDKQVAVAESLLLMKESLMVN
jgi:hypothetical protein